MSIEITIIYSPENINLGQASYHFPDEGGTLGRGANNFWVLEDPHKYMSSVHAQISYIAGSYYLTDVSTNGTFLNGASEPVGNGNQVLLSEGDQFTISDYEFVVKLNGESSSNAGINNVENNPFAEFNTSEPLSTDLINDDIFTAPDNNDPFSSFSSTAVTHDPFSTPISSDFGAQSGIATLETDQQTDPLALLDKGSADSLAPNNFQQSGFVPESFEPSSLSDAHFFEEPAQENHNAVNEAIVWPKAQQESSVIPDDWDDWGGDLDIAPVSVAALPSNTNVELNNTFAGNSENIPPFAEPKANGSFGAIAGSPFSDVQVAPISDDFLFEMPLPNDVIVDPLPTMNNPSILPAQAGDTLTEMSQQQEHINTQDMNLEVPSDVPASPLHSNIEYDHLEKVNQQLQDENAALKIQLASLQKTNATSALNVSTDTLDTVVEAMGLSNWDLSPQKKHEINAMVGLLIRESIQGMMQVLKFRKKIKEEFRINVTTIQSVENNPLKFSANIQDALENMFIKENNAYKTPIDAFKEGFEGIAEHQVAVIAGMQAAFRGMIERFDPIHLESRFDKYKSSSLLKLGKSKKQWDAYKEYHQGLTENLDDSFQHLFGYDFVQAYEEQMQSLISNRITTNTTSDVA